MATRRSTRWNRDKLILETSGEGSAPWRRSKTIQILSLSRNGAVLTMSFRFRHPEQNYDVVLEKFIPAERIGGARVLVHAAPRLRRNFRPNS